MRRALILLSLVAVMALAGVAPAHAAAHSAEVCENWIPNVNYRMGVCVSVHHASGQATAHVRLHTYKKSGGNWVDMVADSQSINQWDIRTNAGYIVNLAPFSGGGVAVRTVHGVAWVILQCPPNEPVFASARVVTVSFRTDSGIPYGPFTLDVVSGFSQRPC
jgi:hypothetical protein